MTKAPAVLDVDQISKQFRGLVALAGISFEVRPGEILGLIGPNGAGKSVLVNIASGIYPASSGTLRFKGRDVTGLPGHQLARLGVARTYQNIRLFKRMTVLENVMVADKRHLTRPFRSLFLGRRRADMDSATAFLDRVGLADKADRLAGTLAYGEARRLEIARALAGQPRLLFLDEPAAGMNENETAALTEVIRGARDLLDAIVVIEHDVELLRSLVDRLLVLDCGRKIAEGDPAVVLADPQVVAAYLGTDDDDDD